MVPSHHRVCMRMAHSVHINPDPGIRTEWQSCALQFVSSHRDFHILFLHQSRFQHSISPDSDYQSPAGYCLSDCSCCCHAADRELLAPRLSVILPRPNNQDRHI
ncbi:hypothetical protein Zmor_021020 [Zophobas morio]|uniref:Uncharacterized protein n=1 Tax=Zophobas morio TaxID=2755281 RepID=A0AA38MAY1_9CUCU|nr:hypothetical protein Zmor_021020 [Zophobas morio]